MKTKKRNIVNCFFGFIDLWRIKNISVVPVTLSNAGVIPKYLLHGLSTLRLSEGQRYATNRPYYGLGLSVIFIKPSKPVMK